MELKRQLMIFAKGFLMGVCDLIPGISGGTIAFITGIYYRLIKAVKDILGYPVLLMYSIFSGQKKRNIPVIKQDLGFLIVLGAGIGSAILVGSRIIHFLLRNYQAYTLAFFIGIILVSSKMIYDEIEKVHSKQILFIIPGFITGLILAFLIPVDIEFPEYSYIFLGGLLASSAMFLPGISGAFVLLIMGLYEFLIVALHRFGDYFMFLIVFFSGVVLGAFVISRIISFLFRIAKVALLYILLGLVLGAVSVPLRKIFASDLLNHANTYIFVILAFCCGMVSIFLLNRMVKKQV